MSTRVLIATAWLAIGAGLAAQAPPAAGTARLEGRVLVSDDGALVRRAIVTLSGGDRPRSWSAITDDNGAFLFTNLPPGRFTLTATRAAFITGSYGAKAPGLTGTRVSLAAGQHLRDVVVRMARGAVIAGAVRNEQGEPIPNAEIRVQAIPRVGSATAAPAGAGPARAPTFEATTDDRGAYRVWGLPAGSYVVAATMPSYATNEAIEILTTAQMDERFAAAQRTLGRPGGSVPAPTARSASAPRAEPRNVYVPVFHPGTAVAAEARPVVVEFADERTGVDITLALTTAAAIEGIVLNPGGPLPQLQVALTPDNTSGIVARVQPGRLAQVAPSGEFRFTAIPPGRYRLTARTIAQGSPSPSGLWASTELVLSGGDVDSVRLVLNPAVRITGRVRFDGTAAVPSDPTTTTVALLRAAPAPWISNEVATTDVGGALPAPTTRVQPNGAFALTNVYPGVYRITSSVPGGAGWRLQAAMVAGRDVLDDPLVIGPDSRDDLAGALLTYTDRRTQVTGRLETPAGAPATEFFVVVFTAERRWWRPESRRLAFARPATDGQFVVHDVPPGEYHIAALTDLDPATWQAPEFLDQVVRGALKFTLSDGETKTQNLRIAQ